jgi:hypothetical protein
MKLLHSILILLFLVGCNQQKPIVEKETESEITNRNLKTVELNQKELLKKSNITKDLILGIWTDGSSENATFEIKQKTIYYVDEFKDYKYFLKNNKIEINYPDNIYSAEILLRNDTLIMNSKEYGQAKYWKYKE